MEQTLTRPLTRAQQARRQRVIDAAMALGLEGGYEAVQMRDVAARADVAMGTVYRYFTSKDHLLAAALESSGLDTGDLRYVQALGSFGRALAFAGEGHGYPPVVHSETFESASRQSWSSESGWSQAQGYGDARYADAYGAADDQSAELGTHRRPCLTQRGPRNNSEKDGGGQPAPEHQCGQRHDLAHRASGNVIAAPQRSRGDQRRGPPRSRTSLHARSVDRSWRAR